MQGGNHPDSLLRRTSRIRGHRNGPDRRLLTCCDLTTKANYLVKSLHEQMSLILEPADFDLGSTNRTQLAKVQLLLRHSVDDESKAVAFSRLVNSPRYDGPDLLERTNPNPGWQ